MVDPAVIQRVEASLEPADRAVARALRKAAKITAAAGVPAEHRPAAFRAAVAVVLERELQAAAAELAAGD